MKKTILLLVVILTLSFTVSSCKTDKKEEKKEQIAEVYQCPMDCENGKTYDKAGSCPVCKMDIKPVSATKDAHSGHKH